MTENGIIELSKEEIEKYKALKEAKQKPKLRLVREIKKEYPDLISITSILYNRVDNVFIEVEKEIRKKLTEKITEQNLGTSIDATIKFLNDKLYVEEEEFFCHNLWLIPFKNGYYNVNTKTFSNKRDKNFFYQIPHNYDGLEYKCPKFTKAVHEWLSWQRNTNKLTIEDIFDIIGYLMTMNVNLKRAFYFFGPTNTGKTTLQDILLYIIGDKNAANIDLSSMQERFGTDGLQLKILNTVSETSSKELQDIVILKRIIGGDKYIRVDVKGIRAGDFLNHVKLLFLGNKLPSVKSFLDESFYDKWIFVNFACQFPIGKGKFSDYIINDPNEIKGIISECIKGVNRLYERGKFRDEITQNNEHIWKFHSNTVYRFIHDKYVTDKESKTLKSKVINSYIDYMFENKLGNVLSNRQIKQELRNMGIVETHSKERYYFKGIRAKTLEDFHPEINQEDFEPEQPEEECVINETFDEYLFRTRQKDIMEAEYAEDHSDELVDLYEEMLEEQDPTPPDYPEEPPKESDN